MVQNLLPASISLIPTTSETTPFRMNIWKRGEYVWKIFQHEK